MRQTNSASEEKAITNYRKWSIERRGALISFYLL